MRLLIALALFAGCEKKKQDEPAPLPTPPAVAPRTPVIAESGLPSECDEYRRTIEALHKCEKMPKQSIEALKQGFEQMSLGWRNVESMPAEARKAMADGCKAGTDALKQASSTMCGVEQLESDVPPECDEYRRMIDVVQKCEKLPLAARDALKQGFDQISKTWMRDQSMPADQRRALVDGCKQAAGALKQVAANSCDLEKSQ